MYKCSYFAIIKIFKMLNIKKRMGVLEPTYHEHKEYSKTKRKISKKMEKHLLNPLASFNLLLIRKWL